MAKIYIKYNPYKLETQITVNGKKISQEKRLYKAVKGKRLQEWIGKFPQMLVDELNITDLDLEFYGMPIDWDDFEDAFLRAKRDGVIPKVKLKFTEGKADTLIYKEIVEFCETLRSGQMKAFQHPKLIKAFQSIENSVFPVNVMATMSAGKSTLINAMLEKKLMPSKNQACTATITEILDDDEEQFKAVVYDMNGYVVKTISELTYEDMDVLNEDEHISRIEVRGDIPFLDAKDMALKLVDTPGPNNSRTAAHRNLTYNMINNDLNHLILYVLNGTQLFTNDDAELLSYIAEQIKKGGKIVRDHFLFVINKMDAFNPEEEDIASVVEGAKKYLAFYGIEEPQIFPCSAFTALNIKISLKGIDIEHLTRAEERNLPRAARDTLPMIDKFNGYEQMHLEKYSTLSPSAQRELNVRISKAKNEENSKEQALIHCGIYSIEAAINAYVKKYARTKKIKDLAETFYEVAGDTKVLEEKELENLNKKINDIRSERMEKIQRVLSVCDCEIADMGEKFRKLFNEHHIQRSHLDEWEELEQLNIELEKKTAELDKDKHTMMWIENCQKEIEHILDI